MVGAQAAGPPRSYQSLLEFTIFTTSSITGTSISTPTTVASAAPDSKPNRLMAAATAIEADLAAPSAHFVFGSDGSGSRRLIIPDGCFRVDAALPESFGQRDRQKLFMDGPEIFNFTLRVVPQCVQEVCSQSGRAQTDIELFLFHQANAFMLRHLAKKMKLDSGKVPMNIERFGNVSSASIPLLMVTSVADRVRGENIPVLMAGFGVGFSWCAAIIEFSKPRVVELID